MATERPDQARLSTTRPGTDPFVTGAPATAGTDLAAAHPTPEKPKSKAELRADATRARAELAGTLDAIELKLNLPYQARLRGRRFRMGARKLQDDNPLAVVGLLAGAVAVVSGTVWLGVRAIQRR
ncbi:hypothetical protein GCM10022381_36280 [Leifsonia kafniensis]|uniref:DUF3618 domain-containing protein n=1 Tax=Leifsonia kafniensis TaxID=475957 RepID=A0ABP7L1J9_9MICO